MATINGVSFNLTDMEIVAVHRNVSSEQPGSDMNFITSMGYNGLAIRVTGFETTLAQYDLVMAEFMRPGAQKLIHRTGWQYSVHSARLIPILSAGIVDNYFPYDLLFLTSTPYRDSASPTCRKVGITSNNAEWYQEDRPCSLVENWGFEDWSAGAASAPDGWTLDAGSVARSTTHYMGTYSAALTRSGTNAYLIVVDTDPAQYVGQTLTLGCWVKASVADTSRIAIVDNAGASASTYHTGGGAWEWLEVSRLIYVRSTTVTTYLMVEDTDTTSYFDNVALVISDSISDPSFSRTLVTAGSVDAVPDIKITSDETTIEVVTQVEKL